MNEAEWNSVGGKGIVFSFVIAVLKPRSVMFACTRIGGEAYRDRQKGNLSDN